MKVHIGQEIEKKFQESGLKITAFADQINKGERNVYSIFKREDINTELLNKISEVLGFDFFSFYQNGNSNSIVREQKGEYGATGMSISLSLNLSVPKDKVGSLPNLLSELSSIASRYGIMLL